LKSNRLILFNFLTVFFISFDLSAKVSEKNQADNEPITNIEKARELLSEDTASAIKLIKAFDLRKSRLPDSSLVDLIDKQLDFIETYAHTADAIQALNNWIEQSVELQSTKLAVKLRNRLSDFYMEEAKYDLGIKQLNQALSELKKEGITEEMGDLLLKKAVMLYSQSKYLSSIEIVFKAISHFEESKQEKQIAFSYLQIGSTYLYIDFLEEAEEYYQLAAEHFLKFGDTLGHAICRSNIGLVAHEQGNYEKAIQLLKQALVEIRKSERDIMIAFAYQSLAESYLEMKEIDSAFFYCQKSMEMDRRLQYNSGQAKDFYLMSGIKNELGDSDSALYYAEQAIELLNREPDHEIDYDLSLLLADLYEKRGNFVKSNAYLRRRIRVMENIDEENKKIQQLTGREDDRLKETLFELELSKEREKNQQIKNANQKKTIFFLIALSLIFLIALGVVLYFNRNKRKLNRELGKELKIKRSLLKEIHHRVKNNLQIISSMLSIQSQYIHDAELKKILAECRGRINSMSLIHESLYKSENRITPLFNDYVEELVPRLISTYQVDQSQIKSKLDLDQIELSLDESIPCGLIINELVSNALKHAFEKGEKGEIYIQMKLQDNQVKLKVADNGKGLPKNFDMEKQDTFGFLLISTLTHQLEADLKFKNQAGLTVEVSWEKDFGEIK